MFAGSIFSVIALAARRLVHTERMANGKEQEPKEKKPKQQKPKEQKPGEQKPKEPKPKEQAQKKGEKGEKGVLEAAAEAIGSTLGAIAVKTGMVHPEPRAKQPKIPKLAKKNKQRLPRKEKKRARKVRGGDAAPPAR